MEEKTLKVNVARQQEYSYGMTRKPIYGIYNPAGFIINSNIIKSSKRT